MSDQRAAAIALGAIAPESRTPLSVPAEQTAPDATAPEPVAPEALTVRVAQLLATVDAPGDPIERHMSAAEQTVARLLRDQSTSRASALDLLAADALATYAFELAADAPETIPELAARAMARFAALAAAAPPAAAPLRVGDAE